MDTHSTTAIVLDVVTPERAVLHDVVDEVAVPGVNGEFGVLPNHTPMQALLGVGILTARKGSQLQYYAVNGGYASLNRDRLVILTETCEAASEIDLARAKRALEQSEKALTTLDGFSEESQREQERYHRAQVRVDVAATKDR